MYFYSFKRSFSRRGKTPSETVKHAVVELITMFQKRPTLTLARKLMNVTQPKQQLIEMALHVRANVITEDPSRT